MTGRRAAALAAAAGWVLGGAGCKREDDNAGSGRTTGRTVRGHRKKKAGRFRRPVHRFGGRRRMRRSQTPAVRISDGDRATVVHVVDGDTVYLKVARNGAKRLAKVRLAGINAPECRKDRVRLAGGRPSSTCVADQELFGLAACRLLAGLVLGKEVLIRCESGPDGLCSRGSYGRYLLDLSVGGRDVAHAMVSAGAALPFTRYFHRNLASLCAAEDRARKQKAGMWSRGPADTVLGSMSRKTRSWYRHRNQRCRMASAGTLR